VVACAHHTHTRRERERERERGETRHVPGVTLGPLMQTSPRSPTGSGFPASSNIAICTLTPFPTDDTLVPDQRTSTSTLTRTSERERTFRGPDCGRGLEAI
jgi:hypothetical protein